MKQHIATGELLHAVSLGPPWTIFGCHKMPETLSVSQWTSHSSDLEREKTKITIAQQVNEKVHREGDNRFCSFTMLEWSGNERRMWYDHLLAWISTAKVGTFMHQIWFSLFSAIIYVILTVSKKFPTISRMKKTLETLSGHDVTTMAPWPDGQKKWRKEICSGSPLYYIP